MTRNGTAVLSLDGQRLVADVPLAFRRRGGRKRIVSPRGTPAWTAPARIDSTLVKALARAHRWQRLLETGAYASLQELARAERINSSYVARVLRLALLSPEIAEAILDGRRAGERVALDALMRPFPVEWDRQAGYLRSS